MTNLSATPLAKDERDRTNSSAALDVQTAATPRYNPRFYKTRSVTPNLFLLFDEKA